MRKVSTSVQCMSECVYVVCVYECVRVVVVVVVVVLFKILLLLMLMLMLLLMMVVMGKFMFIFIFDFLGEHPLHEKKTAGIEEEEEEREWTNPKQICLYQRSDNLIKIDKWTKKIHYMRIVNDG